MGVGALTKRFVFWEWQRSEECACVHTCAHVGCVHMCDSACVCMCAHGTVCVRTYVTACACVCSCDFLCRSLFASKPPGLGE